jgi:UDP-N-acetyl-D-glucosamine dehydrogenase
MIGHRRSEIERLSGCRYHGAVASKARSTPIAGEGGFELRKVAVVGLGYVGLPLALGFLEAGLSVAGLDANPERVDRLRRGESPIDDISDSRLGEGLRGGLGVHGLDGAIVASADMIVVCVPTPISDAREPDISHVVDAARFVGEHLHQGQLVVLQSTTFPGTTAGPFRETLEAASGLIAARDFEIAFAPERINPGDPTSSGREIPRLVGGMTPAGTALAANAFRRISANVIEVSSPDVAELAKLHENIFRNVNIALVNQLALLCERMGVDVWEVIDAAATKPFGFMPFRPGPGVGGHCIPVDPYFLAWRARQFGFVDRFVELAGDINMSMPRHVVDLVTQALNSHGRALNGSRVGVIGTAFKPDVRDSRNSPAADVIALLRERLAEVSYHDPHIPRFSDATGTELVSRDLPALLGDSDAIVVLTGHRAVDWALVYESAELIVDTVGTSRNRVTREMQALLLGRGWVKPNALS